MQANENNIIRTEYSELMQKSYIDYAMSVIIARALPDVRDGLKPVQRRVLYDMSELGVKYDKPHRKSARIVGDTMGKYHPHGDSSIYEALVVMAQDFKKGLPLIDGHGNFGSIEGDGAAAMRYTEARLQKVTQEAYLADLDKDVVDFGPNFDETEKEPLVLPVKVPNLLINGAEGIAVGMATSIPPHNFGEVIDGVIAYMKNPDITTEELMDIASLGRIVPSTANSQAIKFMLVNEPTQNAAIFHTLGWAGKLTDWPGPVEGERPTAYIILLCDLALGKNKMMDDGIIAQTLLLGAVEKGYGGCMLGNIKRQQLADALSIDATKYSIDLVIALGKPIEEIVLEDITSEHGINYYRDSNNVHHVPKRSLEDLIIHSSSK